jgi:hypothetical protein
LFYFQKKVVKMRFSILSLGLVAITLSCVSSTLAKPIGAVDYPLSSFDNGVEAEANTGAASGEKGSFANGSRI